MVKLNYVKIWHNWEINETKLYSFTLGKYGKFIAEIIAFTINH